MTYIYDWYSFPDRYSIVCKSCKKEAIFSEGKLGHKQKSSITGNSTCLHCGYSGDHIINWPDDAFYKIAIKDNILWAWDITSLKELIKYIESKERNPKKHKGFLSYLSHLPKVFQEAKVRDEIVSKLHKILPS